MTMKAEQDLIDSLEREIEEFHELRKRYSQLSQQGPWSIPGSSAGAPDVDAPLPQRSSSQA